MKNVNRILVIAMIVAFGIISCSKERTSDTKQTPPTGIGNEIGTVAQSAPDNSSKQWVTVSSSGSFAGQYISSYGGGITFGTNLPHPIDSDPNGYYDGQPIPTIEYVNWTLNNAPIEYVVNGAYFLLIEPTFSSDDIAMRKRVDDYKKDVDKYFADTTGTVPYPVPIGTSTGSGGGVKELRGMLIRDHTSPTLMAVCSDKYKPGAPLQVD
jgi:hypothetical protein